MHPLINDIGSYLSFAVGGAASVTAGGAGDATLVSGPWIDRLGYNSLAVALHLKATLAATKTIACAANLQDADDASGTNAAAFGTAYPSTVLATGAGGGSTEEKVTKILTANLATARRWVRVQFTPDLSATATDVAAVDAVVVLGGADTLPAS